VSDHPFYRLAPFLQEYIYAHEWSDLRPIQAEACRVLLDTDAHLLLTSGTASGKTEAAFLPILTQLHQRPALSVGVLYISPLKALINNQFVRVGDMLRDADIPVWHWHGDVPQSHKKKLLKHPSGVLQITPESLESLFVNRRGVLTTLFSDLRFVVVDEVHAFIGSDRGGQLSCQLARLEREIRAQPRRIGLSATLGKPELAETWLRGSTDRPVITPNVPNDRRSIRLSLQHFFVDDASVWEKLANVLTRNEPVEVADEAIGRYVYEVTHKHKSLIFSNSRGDAEDIITTLRLLAERDGQRDIYHVHHGSISTSLRTAAEAALRDDEHSVAAATSTLELGIDIGQLERVVQLNSPFSVSSFLQRLGRSGRRDQPAEMWFVLHERMLSSKSSLPEQIPWNLLQSIAITQLYLEEKWIEPTSHSKLPTSLLYHQTMSILASVGELTPAGLARQVLSLPPFRSVSQDDFRTLLRHLLEIDHLQRTDEGGVIVGLTGERIVKSFRFLAVFATEDEYKVYEGSAEIGSLAEPPAPGDRFALAGRSWETIAVDAKRKIVEARRVKGKATTVWGGSGPDIHARILQRMRDVLREDTAYQYLSAQALHRLTQARALAKSAGVDRHNVVALGGDTYCVFGWMGSTAFRMFHRLFDAKCKQALSATKLDPVAPFFAEFSACGKNRGLVLDTIQQVITSDVKTEELLKPDEVPVIGKYDEFVPGSLRRRAFSQSHLDVAELRCLVQNWRLREPAQCQRSPPSSTSRPCAYQSWRFERSATPMSAANRLISVSGYGSSVGCADAPVVG